MKVSIGLDIGISSVGFSVIELNSKKVLELGSHIFSSGSAEKNQERRSFRGTRRGIRRKRNRLADLEKLLKEVGLPTVPKVNAPVYELRVKGLKEELQPSELTSVLYHILKRRGISYDLKDVDEEDASAISNYGASIDTNRRLLTKGKTVGEIQLERFEQYNQVRGMIAGKENKTLLNVFPTSAFIEEGQRILTHQQKFYPFITQDWIEKIVALISRKREYFVGPGSEKSPTKYGLYRRDVNGKITKIGETLFEELIGEDKIGTKIANGVKQRRASASSLSAQIYNLLNDLNNLTVKTANPNVDENGKLTSESKEKIIHALMNNDKKNQLPMTQITKLFDAKVEDVKGWRIDKNEKPMLHSLKAYHNFRFALKELEVEANKLPKDFFDKVADIITMNPEKSEVRKQLDDSSKEDSFMSLFGNIEHLDEIKDLIIQKNKELLIDSKAQWHSFSYVTLNTLIPELIATSKEQMTILTEMGLMKPDNEKYKGLTQVPVREITDKILNPVVSKSVGEALKVYNALAKQYGNKNIEHLVLELPRDDNEQDAKRNIIKFQKEQETEKSASDQEFIDQANISFEVLKQQCKLQRKLAQKIRFWYQQEGNCPYCGKKIDAKKFVNNSEAFEVDHIIPISVSFDDAQNNKVLVHSTCNQEKGKQTPLGWLSRGGGFGLSIDGYKKMVLGNKRYSKQKKENLLNDVDLTTIETRRSFIQRNLNDTRYASKTVLNELYSFMKSNQLPTKVKVVRGKWTSQMRKKWNSEGGLKKSRDTHHHHAIDASIIAAFPLIKYFDRAIDLVHVDMETGEILSKQIDKKEAKEKEILATLSILSNKAFEEKVNEIYSYQLFFDIQKANDIDDPDNPVKFSHKVDKKANRTVANQTIYGTRKKNVLDKKSGKVNTKEEYTFGTIKNIYNVDDYAKFKKKLFDKKGDMMENVFLVQELDPKTWEKLLAIIKEYPETEEITQDNGKVKKVPVSPFELYRRNYGFITKYAKKDNGPKVVSLKYYDSRVGNHIDITPENAKNRVILQSLNPWRTDVYYNKEKEEYEILGLKYKDLKYSNGEYGITKEKYEELKRGLISQLDGTVIEKRVVSKDSEFCFSLYKNDRLLIKNPETSEEVELLFGSRNETSPGYVEMKPIHKSKFEPGEEVCLYGKTSTNGQFLKKLAPKGFELVKINTDILGNKHYTEKEKLKFKIKV